LNGRREDAMIRFKFARILALSGGVIVSPLAIGQEASKTTSPADIKVVETRVKAVTSDDPSTIDVDELIFTTAEAVAGQTPTPGHQESSKQPGVTRSTNTLYTTQAPVFHHYTAQAPVSQVRTLAKDEDALESNFGLTLSDADDALRSQLEIPAGQGVVIVGVK